MVIAGFVMQGPDARTVLIRAAGPALMGLDVRGALAEPELVLYDRNGREITRNRRWHTAENAAAARAAMRAAGAFPFPEGSADSALLITLPPGLYSAHVMGVGGTTGVTLLEVYEVPE